MQFFLLYLQGVVGQAQVSMTHLKNLASEHQLIW